MFLLNFVHFYCIDLENCYWPLFCPWPLQDEDEKPKDKLHQIAYELLTTERAYVARLHLLDQVRVIALGLFFLLDRMAFASILVFFYVFCEIIKICHVLCLQDNQYWNRKELLSLVYNVIAQIECALFLWYSDTIDSISMLCQLIPTQISISYCPCPWFETFSAHNGPSYIPYQ